VDACVEVVGWCVSCRLLGCWCSVGVGKAGAPRKGVVVPVVLWREG
jgi:hypothetical protein